MTTVHIDSAKIIHFFRTIYPHPWPGLISIDFQQKRVNPESGKYESIVKKRIFVFQESLAEVGYEEWATLQERDLCSVYFSVAFRAEAKKAAGKRENVCGVQCLWADKDDAKRGDLETLIAECPLPPTVVNWTGNGFHFYWVLNDTCLAVEPKGPVETLVKRVHKWVKGDKGTHNLNRVLRVPYTYNVKPERFSTEGTFPFCETVYENRDHTYSIEQFLGIRLSKNEIRLEDQFVEKFIINGECTTESSSGKPDRSIRDFLIAKELARAGHSPDEIVWVLTNPAWGCSNKALERNDDGAYAKDTAAKATKAAAIESQEEQLYDDGNAVFRRKYNKSGQLEETKISNFSLTPLRRLSVEDINTESSSELLTFQIRANDSRVVREYTGSTFDMSDKRHFYGTVGIPLISFYGREYEWGMYMDFLSRQEIPTTLGTKTLGWSRNSFVTDKGSIHGDPVSYVDTGISPSIHIVDEPWELTSERFRQMWEAIKLFQRPSASVFALGWFLSSIFAPQIRDVYFDQFPILQITGGPHTGKTTLARTLAKSLFGIMHEYSGKTTFAVLRTALSYTNALPLLIDEAELEEVKHGPEMAGLLRSLWQRGFAQKMEIQTKTILNLRLQAPTILTNISGVSDQALLTRCLTLRLTPYKKSEGPQGKAYFESLPQGGFLRWWIKQDPVWIEKIKAYAASLAETSDRQQHCFATAVAPLLFLAHKFDIFDININQFVSYWREQQGQNELQTSVGAIDILLSNLIRSATIFPLCKSFTGGYIVEGETILIHRAHFVDHAVRIGDSLKLAFPVTRTWIQTSLRDAEKTGEVAKYTDITTRMGKTQQFIRLNLDMWPLTKDAIQTELDPEVVRKQLLKMHEEGKEE